MTKGKLILIGAGPGDPDLITVKGARKIGEADVILYDALANAALLEYAPKHAEKIFVGKRPGCPKNRQEYINSLIVEKASLGNCVVRLKGGDPFIFGRGHEELTYAQDAGISTEVVPGLSSSMALSGLQKFPLTKRGINESFWVVTGTTKSGELSEDLNLAAQSTATVVVLMGMRKLRQIVSLFRQFHLASTPVAIIEKGSTPDEKTGLGTLETIVEIAEQKSLSSPALIIIGEVVSLHPDYIKSEFSSLYDILPFEEEF